MKGYIQIGQTQHEIYNAPNKTKVPDTLFYNNYQVSIWEILIKATNEFDKLALFE